MNSSGMWTLLGSWPFIVGLLSLVPFTLVVAWLRGGRGRSRGLIAVGFFIVTTVAGLFMMVLPMTIEDTTCIQTATPIGVNQADLDSVAAKELEGRGYDVNRFECRDALRTRYLGSVISYGLVNGVVAGALALRRKVRGA
mgnify:FL=1